MGNKKSVPYKYSSSNIDEVESNIYKRRILMELEKYTINHVCTGSCNVSNHTIQNKYDFKYKVVNKLDESYIARLISVKTYEKNPSITHIIVFNIETRQIDCDKLHLIPNVANHSYVAVVRNG